MEFNIHDLGDLVRVEASFSDAILGGAIDPDVVKLSVLAPDGTVTTYTYSSDVEIIKDDVGQYYSDVNANQSGMWFYRWWSLGNGQASEERRFQVRPAMAVESP